ncbi:MAG: alpha/beta fold hydrolase [Candidatus Thioglobus sp.]|uniref:alpha/beta fold hydrolase n=1 Tax=Candidatus Thioglobus sp. TaxID=2026721 RepID=UPI0026130D9A|nr:alpha/beta fold hydrolase [Candidatus Thioglobus sp.]MDC9726261.1 alpha/beta fold hydrolase [Candidatus Thioglobus sp.]
MLYSQTTGAGPDLVLLHGWGFNSDLFDSLIEKYKHQYRITKIDLPGHGRSDDVAGGLDEWCDEIIKLLPNNPILLGWSLGGLLAINLAKKIKLSKLILVASTPNFVQNSHWQYGINADNFQQFSNALSLNLSKGLKRFVSLQTQNKNQLKTLIQSIDTLPASASALNQGLEILLTSDLTEHFKHLSIPIEATLGSRDTLVPHTIKQWYSNQNISVSLLDTGHLPFLHNDFKL